MLEPTKTRHTDEMKEFTVYCPTASYPVVLDFLRNSGREIEEDDLDIPISSPGAHLRGLCYREDLTQAQLAELVGIPRHHISEMENDKRPIGKKNARKLAECSRRIRACFFPNDVQYQ